MTSDPPQLNYTPELSQRQNPYTPNNENKIFFDPHEEKMKSNYMRPTISNYAKN